MSVYKYGIIEPLSSCWEKTSYTFFPHYGWLDNAFQDNICDLFEHNLLAFLALKDGKTQALEDHLPSKVRDDIKPIRFVFNRLDKFEKKSGFRMEKLTSYSLFERARKLSSSRTRYPGAISTRPPFHPLVWYQWSMTIRHCIVSFFERLISGRFKCEWEVSIHTQKKGVNVTMFRLLDATCMVLSREWRSFNMKTVTAVNFTQSAFSTVFELYSFWYTNLSYPRYYRSCDLRWTWVVCCFESTFWIND